MPILSRLLTWLPGRAAPVDFRPLKAAERRGIEELLARTPQPVAPLAIVEALGLDEGYRRVGDEVRRRCGDAEVWQNFYLDLLDEEGEKHDEGEGVGAQPVAPDEELLRLLAGVSVYPQVRARYAWELGYHTLRFALCAGADAKRVAFAAAAATEDFLLAYGAATDLEGKVNALGDLAGARIAAGDESMGASLCDYAASISAPEAVRQELHRLRREGMAFVRESYGA